MRCLCVIRFDFRQNAKYRLRLGGWMFFAHSLRLSLFTISPANFLNSPKGSRSHVQQTNKHCLTVAAHYNTEYIHSEKQFAIFVYVRLISFTKRPLLYLRYVASVVFTDNYVFERNDVELNNRFMNCQCFFRPTPTKIL